MVIVIGNIAYGIFQLSKSINPYIEFLFSDMKSYDEIQDFYIDNEDQIHNLVNILNKLAYKKISIYDWIILQEKTIYADDNEILLDDAFDNVQIVLDFFEKGVKYIEKNNDVIHIVTDSAIDYSRGIAWLEIEKNELSSIHNEDNVYYTKRLSDNFWIFEERD
ncbi:MAG: hypothetical protein E7396_01175 [Ruminococcaceae bacterium]|nr:hypothetical protein [Oscillospiraceae bacterium]